MVWDWINTWALALFGVVITAITAFGRIIFTNQSEIKMLKQSLEQQNTYRAERDNKLENQLTEIRSDIKSLMHTGLK